MNYSYDNLYRLTSEVIAGDPHNVNGAVSYVYDLVGNRTSKTSTLPGMPGGLTNYNANDQLSTDSYDANGNISDISDTPCIVKAIFGGPGDCERGCIAWQNWMLNVWFPQARAQNFPSWQYIALSPVYSIEFPIPFAHNYVRATFPIAPLILDPWRDYQNPVWDEKDYMRVVGLSPTPGTFYLFSY